MASDVDRERVVLHTYQYIHIVQEPLRVGRKMHEYLVVNNCSEETLARIAWSGAWRQFVFVPSDTEWSVGCLDDVRGFMDSLNKEHARQVQERMRNTPCIRRVELE